MRSHPHYPDLKQLVQIRALDDQWFISASRDIRSAQFVTKGKMAVMSSSEFTSPKSDDSRGYGPVRECSNEKKKEFD